MTNSEENYLKIIYHLSLFSNSGISTNAIANAMDSKPSSVTDMIQKLADKDLVLYKKYQGVQLTEKGRKEAIYIVRKHRLWEVFLVSKLGFKWDEVHDIAEQLEHINSEKLIDNLDKFLEFPVQDPHGDPIPNKEGNLPKIKRQLLSEASLHTKLTFVGVNDSSTSFLQYLDKQNISLGSMIEILDKEEFDNSMKILVNGQEIIISNRVSNNIFIK